MSKQKSGGLILSFTLLGVARLCVGQPVAEGPVYKVDDYWKFRHTSTDTTVPGKKRTTWSRKIVEVHQDGLRVIAQDGKLRAYDPAMNPIQEEYSENSRILVRYPLKVGLEWNYNRKFSDSSLTDEKGKAKVVAFESVTVPAGTFDCYRVDVKTEMNYKAYRKINFFSRWYCPRIKWIAKEHHQTYIFSAATGGGATKDEISELMEFTLGQ